MVSDEMRSSLGPTSLLPFPAAIRPVTSSASTRSRSCPYGRSCSALSSAEPIHVRCPRCHQAGTTLAHHLYACSYTSLGKSHEDAPPRPRKGSNLHQRPGGNSADGTGLAQPTKGCLGKSTPTGGPSWRRMSPTPMEWDSSATEKSIRERLPAPRSLVPPAALDHRD
jgi:hypothetical protein